MQTKSYQTKETPNAANYVGDFLTRTENLLKEHVEYGAKLEITMDFWKGTFSIAGDADDLEEFEYDAFDVRHGGLKTNREAFLK